MKKMDILVIKQQIEIENLKMKINNFIQNCVKCLLADRKQGKREGFLKPIPKEEIPLSTYQEIFGNPERLISDRGSAFTSHEFENYCKENFIEHILITTGVPRGNGQVERLNRTIISVLTKLCASDEMQWYKHVKKVHIILNSTHQRSIGTTPFELLVGRPMKRKEDLQILQLIEDENKKHYNEYRDQQRAKAKNEILKIQEENCKNYNKRAKSPYIYKVGDLVMIKRTQFTNQKKLKCHFLGPYKITAVNSNNRYDVEKCSNGEGPQKTKTSADNIKKYIPED